MSKAPVSVILRREQGKSCFNTDLPRPPRRLERVRKSRRWHGKQGKGESASGDRSSGKGHCRPDISSCVVYTVRRTLLHAAPSGTWLCPTISSLFLLASSLHSGLPYFFLFFFFAFITSCPTWQAPSLSCVYSDSVYSGNNVTGKWIDSQLLLIRQK